MNQGSKSCGVFLERIFGKIRVRDPCVTLSVRESAYFDVFSTPVEGDLNLVHSIMLGMLCGQIQFSMVKLVVK